MNVNGLYDELREKNHFRRGRDNGFQADQEIGNDKGKNQKNKDERGKIL